LNKSLLQIIEASTKSDKKKAPYDKFIEFNREEGDLLVERKKKDGSSFDDDDSEKLKDVELLTFNDELRNMFSQLTSFYDGDGSKTEVYNEIVIKGFLDLLFGDIPKEEDGKLTSSKFKKVLNTFEFDNESNKNSIYESLRQAKLLYNDLENVSVLRALLTEVRKIFASKFG
jgi:hypothetical protein